MPGIIFHLIKGWPSAVTGSTFRPINTTDRLLPCIFLENNRGAGKRNLSLCSAGYPEIHFGAKKGRKNNMQFCEIKSPFQ